eukprot:3023431-Rhodomonas_salina.10
MGKKPGAVVLCGVRVLKDGREGAPLGFEASAGDCALFAEERIERKEGRSCSLVSCAIWVRSRTTILSSWHGLRSFLQHSDQNAAPAFTARVSATTSTSVGPVQTHRVDVSTKGMQTNSSVLSALPPPAKSTEKTRRPGANSGDSALSDFISQVLNFRTEGEGQWCIW